MCGFGVLRCGALVMVITVALSAALSLVMDGRLRMLYPAPGFAVEDIPDLTGQVALVTGASTGIGFATSLELLRKGCIVYVGTRSKAKNLETVERLTALSGGNGSAVALHVGLDLASFASIRIFAEALTQAEPELNILINNAGVMHTPFGLTDDGFETQFAVNHLGPFLLTLLLTQSLVNGAPSRVVNVASSAHARPLYEGGLALDILNDEESYNMLKAYGRSKLANALFTLALDQRVGEYGVYVNTCHPGAVATDLGRHLEERVESIFGEAAKEHIKAAVMTLLLSPTQGALTQLFLATSPRVVDESIRGQFWLPVARHPGDHGFRFGQKVSDLAMDLDLAEELWDFSVAATQLDITADDDDYEEEDYDDDEEPYDEDEDA